jgi:hypothetical protein
MSAARATGVLAAFLVVLAGCKPAAPTLPEANAVNAGCNLPTTAPGPTADFTAFANYSWLLFQAVNWPVGSSRGVPDCRKPIGTNGTTVWESYKTVEQIFLPNAADPGPWNDGKVGAMRLTFRSKAPEQLPLEASIAQAVGGWLIDQRGSPTYYHVAVNEASYDYVRSNNYYNADVLNAASAISFRDGSLEVKGAWRIVNDTEKSRYHTREADVMTFDANGKPSGQYRKATVGLVGFHIVYKAPGFPQWTWATFEQIDNAPDASRTTGTWSYFTPSCTGPFCAVNVSPLVSHAPFSTPNRITRITPIRTDIQTVNAAWQARMKGTPFQYYRLIAPQWPSDPNDPGNPQGTPTPGTVANVVLESYVQPTSSCMDCHSTARVPNNRIKTNYSFIFLFAQSPGGRSH